MNCKECKEFCQKEGIETPCDECLQGVYEEIEEW